MHLTAGADTEFLKRDVYRSDLRYEKRGGGGGGGGEGGL